MRVTELSFKGFLEDAKDRTSVVVTFLAVLELMHYGKIKISQESLFSEILIESLEDEDAVIDESIFGGAGAGEGEADGYGY